MSITVLNQAQDWFHNMVSKYSLKDSITEHNLKLKYHHSLETQKNASHLATSLGLNESEIIIAQIIGLLHDCGRFPQFYHYGTFRDNLSRDHAKWAVEIIEKESILNDLSPQEEEWTLDAIFYHNEYKLPSNLKEKNALFCKIIRDVDKLDIYRIMLENQYILDHKPPGDPSPNIINSIFRKECVWYEHVINETDFKLLQLSWVFDLNFKWSHHYLIESNLLESLIGTLPPIKDEERIKSTILEYVNKVKA